MVDFRRRIDARAGAMFEPETDDPFEQVRRWFAAAEASEPNDANAMTLATADKDGRPEARNGVLTGLEHRGFTFFTNTDGQKGRQLEVHPFEAPRCQRKQTDRQGRR